MIVHQAKTLLGRVRLNTERGHHRPRMRLILHGTIHATSTGRITLLGCDID